MFVATLIVSAPHFTGIAVHEWLGIAFAAAVGTHLALHWRWIVETGKRIFSKLPNMTRVNALLNVLLLLDVALIAFSGIMISRSVVPMLGITIANSRAWRGAHNLAATGGFALIGLHVALHWRWIADCFKRYVLTPAPAAQVPGKPAGAIAKTSVSQH